MFFRRALDTGKKLACKGDGKCENLKCRFCRFHKCIRVGMKFVDCLEDPINVLSALKRNDEVRLANFLKGRPSSDVKIKDIFTQFKFNFFPKPAGTQFDFYEWGVMNHLTCINFAMNLSFMRYLSLEDSQLIFKHSHLMYLILVTAWRSFSTRMSVMCHPDGSDIFPEEVEQSGYNEVLLNSIRSQLISRLIELKVTEEEFLLLSALLLCNTATPNLSQIGQTLMEAHRVMYATTLLRYCQHTYGHHAPTRFTDILSLWTTIGNTQNDIDKFSALFPIVQPQDVKTNLFTEILAFLLN
uniref:NR LBD domain-containing protein n=1 Tax=Caenorhabditis tropicalis TaxID=1561998 RepID=A0A1I7U9H6_9PELO